ncbi:hypothetical protein I5G59_gp32 [Mycobacterium phage LilMcDreamy]|uniref:Uncharacterized protein n=1 Tax=Mycobacterium phage LilMcDreamy TaxID=2652422 RepID=A0A5P8D888_9CAUD|nr:hypothetical protein I5G59_gp32 [Mycobacterium phage LilMcDreamy]QFP94652.1 hypothetical protein SEA_LILMCDREAMY_32 [Mycobacterium phage LilMcDreamy]
MAEPRWLTSLKRVASAAKSRPYEPEWINGPVDFDDITEPGVYWIAGEFLNGDAPDPNTYNVPGNTGMVRLEVSVVRNYEDTPPPTDAPGVVIFQDVVGGWSPVRAHRIWQAGAGWSGWNMN